MYGTVATMRVKPGMEAKFQELSERWWNERAPKVKGAIADYVYRTDNDPNELVMAVVFDSKENYVANAGDPQQDAWYREWRECLEADPVWSDGEIVFHRHL
jgi:L-rhamnose mutarotase